MLTTAELLLDGLRQVDNPYSLAAFVVATVAITLIMLVTKRRPPDAS